MTNNIELCELAACQEKILEQEQHIGNCEKTIFTLRNVKIRLEDRVEELEKENAKLRGA